MGSQVHRFMGSWVHGFMGSWVHGCMGSWVHGFMGSWAHGSQLGWGVVGSGGRQVNSEEKLEGGMHKEKQIIWEFENKGYWDRSG